LTPLSGVVVLHSNPQANCEKLVEAMADLLDSLLKCGHHFPYVEYVSAILPVQRRRKICPLI
jgi:hypothetical protein